MGSTFTEPDAVLEDLPYPEGHPTLDLWPTIGRAFRLGRSATFEANRRGEFPFPVWRIGRRLVAPTAGVRAALGMPIERPND